MRVLVIGGNRFLGIELTAQLLARGDDVTLLNRGTLLDPFGPRVTRLQADRGTDAFDAALNGKTWDAVVDCALFDGPQTERLLRVIRGKTAQVIVISTGQVYLVRTPRPVIATEADFDGPVLAASPSVEEEPDWRYGIEKRDVERLLGLGGVPFTTFRLPMVQGARDARRRIDSVLWRLMDGGPVLLTNPDVPVRHVFSTAVVRAIVAQFDAAPRNRAYNLAWSEALTGRTFVEAIARVFGATARLAVHSKTDLQAAGLDPTLACTVNSPWMSALDASLARQELGFTHEPLDLWLPQVIHGVMARWTEAPPSMEQRARELSVSPSRGE
jgi:nucleoside-diphosphate-sugar epimerase